MRVRLAAFALMFCCCASPWSRAQAPGTPSTRLAVWRLQPLGLEAETAERLEVLLRAEAGRLKGIELQPLQQTEAILAAHPNLAKCAGQNE